MWQSRINLLTTNLEKTIFEMNLLGSYLSGDISLVSCNLNYLSIIES